MGTVGNMPRGQRRFQPITFRVEMLKRLILVAIHSLDFRTIVSLDNIWLFY